MYTYLSNIIIILFIIIIIIIWVYYHYNIYFNVNMCMYIFKSLTRVSPDFELLTTDEKLLMIIDEGCKHRPILKTILDMWIARFN